MRATHKPYVLMALCLLLCHCGQATVGQIYTDGDSVDVTQTNSNIANCLSDDDCDGDGTPSTCDFDDNDSTETATSCDNDGDGFLDNLCLAEDFDTNNDGFISAEERGTSCDVCIDYNNPDQIDDDGDGIGDLCFDVIIDTGVEPPKEDSTPSHSKPWDVDVGKLEPAGTVFHP